MAKGSAADGTGVVLGVDSVWGRLGGQLQRSAGPGHRALCKDAKEPRLPSRLGVFPSAPDKVSWCLQKSTGGSERMLRSVGGGGEAEGNQRGGQ